MNGASSRSSSDADVPRSTRRHAVGIATEAACTPMCGPSPPDVDLRVSGGSSKSVRAGQSAYGIALRTAVNTRPRSAPRSVTSGVVLGMLFLHRREPGASFSEGVAHDECPVAVGAGPPILRRSHQILLVEYLCGFAAVIPVAAEAIERLPRCSLRIPPAHPRVDWLVITRPTSRGRLAPAHETGSSSHAGSRTRPGSRKLDRDQPEPISSPSRQTARCPHRGQFSQVIL